jgi:ABC-type amino acid transport system permease subunit
MRRSASQGSRMSYNGTFAPSAVLDMLLVGLAGTVKIALISIVLGVIVGVGARVDAAVASNAGCARRRRRSSSSTGTRRRSCTSSGSSTRCRS